MKRIVINVVMLDRAIEAVFREYGNHESLTNEELAAKVFVLMESVDDVFRLAQGGDPLVRAVENARASLDTLRVELSRANVGAT